MHAPSHYTTSGLMCNVVLSVYCHRNVPKVVTQHKRPTECIFTPPMPKTSRHDILAVSVASPQTAPSLSDITAEQLIPKMGCHPMSPAASIYRSQLSHLRAWLRQAKSALHLQTLKKKKAEAKLQCIECKRPALQDFKPQQQAFIGLQMCSIGVSYVAEYRPLQSLLTMISH